MESLKILSESLGESSDEDFVVGEEEEESDTQEESEN